MDQDDYEYLASPGCGTHHLNDDEAKMLINREFGFEASRIKIIRKVATYRVEGAYLKVDQEYERGPVYAATDWNYVRFDVGNWQYEMENGDLHFYVS
jgi:hypothetical protein